MKMETFEVIKTNKRHGSNAIYYVPKWDETVEASDYVSNCEGFSYSDTLEGIPVRAKITWKEVNSPVMAILSDQNVVNLSIIRGKEDRDRIILTDEYISEALSSLSVLKNLSSIYFENHNNTAIDAKTLNTLFPKLKVANFYMCTIANLNELSSITNLELSNCLYKLDDLCSLGNNLKSLHLNNDSIVCEDLNRLKNLKSLKKLENLCIHRREDVEDTNPIFDLAIELPKLKSFFFTESSGSMKRCFISYLIHLMESGLVNTSIVNKCRKFIERNDLHN